MYQTIIVIAAAIVVFFVPATRTELHNTRESPLRPVVQLAAALESPTVWVVAAASPRPLVLPHEPVVTGPFPRRGPAKRRVPAGVGKLGRARTGPLAWAWEDLGRYVTAPGRAMVWVGL